ncbi:MAG TPA: DUF6279 family lipoprotein [Oxalicibacterium sp.]|uniref:DUF6279 family lipoprotein n=1 Tax=Oxalicibacterium sp. TaxID=2766525 RepID=UPI002BC43582|nr:DUF6279 family lipoprotein [Oxalicibacterium sp.]HWU97295.1 DUF6279 family lipoprotein [Oxalicibacterium sp.]
MTKRLLILGLASMLLACSAARIGYNNGETVSYWWLNSYVDFESEQKPWVKQHIDELFAWHRKTQLREYVQLVSRIQHRDLSTVTKADLLGDYDDGRTRLTRITERAAPDLADLALSLTPAQIANIDEKFTKNNDKFRKEYLKGGTAERQEFRYKKMMKQAEYWFGNFSREQETRLRALSDARPLNNELMLAERMQRQKELIAMLRKIHAEKPSRDATATMIRKYVADTINHFGNKQQQAFADATTEANAALVAEMMRMATPEQKRHFINTLQDWVSDFNRLSAKASS